MARSYPVYKAHAFDLDTDVSAKVNVVTVFGKATEEVTRVEATLGFVGHDIEILDDSSKTGGDKDLGLDEVVEGVLAT